MLALAAHYAGHGKNQCGQDGDDSNDNEQFYQGKATKSVAGVAPGRVRKSKTVRHGEEMSWGSSQAGVMVWQAAELAAAEA